MPTLNKLRIAKAVVPADIPKQVNDIIERIINHPNVHGVMFFRDHNIEMCTVPRYYSARLTKFLPLIWDAVHLAVTEIDVTDELIAFRMETKAFEILVTGGRNFGAVVVQRKEKKSHTINQVNPIIDRIMDDESVVSVVMTNKEGNPILTNISLNTASNFAKAVYPISIMARILVTELDVFDEALALRIKTKNYEILLCPHTEFNILVVQQKRITQKNATKRTPVLKEII